MTDAPLAAVRASAPGRVNLLGEHIDYNGGHVLPLAIPQRADVQLSRRFDRLVSATSAAFDAPAAVYQLGAEQPRRTWLDYVQGVTHVLARGVRQPFEGFDLHVDSTVPLGSGLSSSAALEVALLRGLRTLFALDLDDVTIARLAQRAEVEFVGANVGIMDQMACSLADEHAALFLDTITLAYERIPVPATCEVGVLHSGITHGHAAGDYNTRRAECAEAARLLGVTYLCSLSEADSARIEALPEPLNRRARHAFTEERRTVRGAALLRAGHLETLGALLDQSHASLRDDFQVSLPEIDLLVTLARQEPGVFGARITGGGFGGSIVVLAEHGAARRALEDAAEAYQRQTGKVGATVLVPARLPPGSESPPVSSSRARWSRRLPGTT